MTENSILSYCAVRRGMRRRDDDVFAVAPSQEASFNLFSVAPSCAVAAAGGLSTAAVAGLRAAADPGVGAVAAPGADAGAAGELYFKPMLAASAVAAYVAAVAASSPSMGGGAW